MTLINLANSDVLLINEVHLASYGIYTEIDTLPKVHITEPFL